MKKIACLALLCLLSISCYTKKEVLAPVLLNYSLYYPDEAREQELEGTVLVRVLVNEYGKISDVIIHESSGNPLLDSAAVKTALTFTFSTPKRDGEKTKMWVLVPIEFKLRLVEPEYWLTEVKILQKMIYNKYSKEWINRLYELYKQMIYTPRDHNLEVNYYIRETVLDTTAQIWKGYWDSYSANILLFIDIIYRFPESFTSLEAKADFNNFLKKERLQIKYNLPQAEADSLMNRLRKAVED
jgi:TonB family protein